MTSTDKAANLRARLRTLFGGIVDSYSANASGRGAARILASVLHTTESSDGSLWSIVNYFKRAGSDASSSYVVGDGDPDKNGFTEVVRVVPEKLKPWTQRSANPIAVSYEMIGRASRTRAQWLGKYRAQVRTVAALCAEDALEYKLPVRRALPGHLGHVDLSKYGYPQDHTDPGLGFPWDVFKQDVQTYVDMGKGVGVPATKAIVIKRVPRPKAVPIKIPQWAWDHRAWALSGKAGPRPHSVNSFLGTHVKIPKWYWAWRIWYDATGGRH